MVNRIITIDNDSKVRNDLYAAFERANRGLSDEDKFFTYTAGNVNAACQKIEQSIRKDWKVGDKVYVFQDIMMDEGNEEGLRQIRDWDELARSGTSLEHRITGLIILSSVADKVTSRTEVTGAKNFPVYACKKELVKGSYGPKAVDYLLDVINERVSPLNELEIRPIRLE